MIYFPDFCQLVLSRFRQSESEEEDFFQTVFKVRKGERYGIIIPDMALQTMCGTEPYPTDFKAKKYKLEKQALTKVA